MFGIEIIEKSKEDRMYKILSLIFGLILTIGGFTNSDIIKIVLGLVLIFYFTYSKKTYLGNEGIIYIYKGFLLNRKEEIKFQDIEEITLINKNNKCIMFLIKEPMAKKLMVDYRKVDEIIKFINKNTNIPIVVDP